MSSERLSEYVNSLKGKKIAIVGIGVSNRPLAKLLLEAENDVTICDKSDKEKLGDTYTELSSMGARFSLGDDYLENISADIIFRTPGLHPKFLQKYADKGAILTSEMEVFFSLCPCKTIAITGSDGKTTTSTLISEFLKEEGYTVHLGGNIGRPLLCDIPDFTEKDIAVLELSSFQLHGMKCSPDVAVVTNIAPNHLDVHPTFEDYCYAKESIFSNQKAESLLVLNFDNDITREFAGKAAGEVLFFSSKSEISNGACLKDGNILLNGKVLLNAGDIKIPGAHNVENYMTAICATKGLVSEKSILKVAREFGGVEHRIEFIRELRGVKYYNDSIASSPTRTIAGLRSFDRKVILIAGGHDKLIPFKPLAEEVMKRVKALFVSGETAEKIAAAVKAEPGWSEELLPVTVCPDFEAVTKAASAYAKEGDIVILSPACSSFDCFPNFAVRGRTFKKLVNELS